MTACFRSINNKDTIQKAFSHVQELSVVSFIPITSRVFLSCYLDTSHSSERSSLKKDVDRWRLLIRWGILSPGEAYCHKVRYIFTSWGIFSPGRTAIKNVIILCISSFIITALCCCCCCFILASSFWHDHYDTVLMVCHCDIPLSLLQSSLMSVITSHVACVTVIAPASPLLTQPLSSGAGPTPHSQLHPEHTDGGPSDGDRGGPPTHSGCWIGCNHHWTGQSISVSSVINFIFNYVDLLLFINIFNIF